MRLLARIIGVWVLALAVILFVMDGTRMLAAGGFVATPLLETWADFFPGGPGWAQESIEAGPLPLLWDPVLTTLVNWPGWAVLGGLGLALVILGRRPSRRRFVRQDHF